MKLGLGLGINKGVIVTNLFKDATLAFSLRDLGLGADYAVRVRRDSDNAEQDFTANEITDGTLEGFVGSGNGYVSIWYNQIGGNDAIQNTATQQPMIVNGSGNLITKLGKPAIYMTEGLYLFVDNPSIVTVENGIESYVVFSVDGSPSKNKGIFGKWGGTKDEYALLNDSKLKVTSKDTNNIQTNTESNYLLNSETALIEARFNFSFQEVLRNQISLIKNQINDVLVSDNKLTIGTYTLKNSQFTTVDSYYQDLVIFKTKNSGKQTEIRKNINDYYGIY